MLRTPMVRIHTIAAGGGSVLTYRDGRLQAGPESAGASPGPLSYGRGGPLAVTDANLRLGRIQPDYFPNVFGPDGSQPLDTASVAQAFDTLTAQLNADGFAYTPEQTAAGFLAVAVDNMANAIRQISVQRGLDPADFTLCCFGGAGGQHACDVADNLGMTRILLDPLAPVLSAWGMGTASLSAYRQQAINLPLSEDNLAEVDRRCLVLEDVCLGELRQQGSGDATLRRWLHIKVKGSDTTLPIEYGFLDQLHADFTAAHLGRFGFAPADSALEIESLRVEATGISGSSAQATAASTTEVPATAQAEIYLAGEWQRVPVVGRAQLPRNQDCPGPLLVVDTNNTIVVNPGWHLRVNEADQVLLERPSAAEVKQLDDTAVDPVRLEIFNNLFMNIAEQMGVVLENTAASVNIKERLDFSCAVFDPSGDLVANAPHMPVHLGSMLSLIHI